MKKFLSILLIMLLMLCDMRVTEAANDASVTYIVKPTLDYGVVLNFHDGFAAVKKNGEYGIIDKTGIEVLPVIYEYVTDFWNEYDDVPVFYEGMARVARFDKNGYMKWGFIEKTDKEVIAPIYNGASNFYDGIAIVNKDGTCCFIDKTGKVIISQISNNYYEVHNYHEGLAAVRKDFKWGYIDKTGKIIILFIYSSVGDFYEGIAPVEENGKWGIIANPLNASEVQKTISNSKNLLFL
ncbi:WG repeat-containing protein [Thermoanaerobacterium thermosaccharolyticum]|uniref:WG repeat-containing protein n=1 Tax=Thermoanaerobacterium thermosaccharolyticum TaxID=1517 RepID=UPI003DA7E0DA